jgi:SOS-response transcriptional repressor LexA
MRALTRRQKQILDFIQRSQQADGITPSLRDIAHEFEFRSMTTAAEHVQALRKKGALAGQSRRARSLQVISPLQNLRKRVVDIPLFRLHPRRFCRGSFAGSARLRFD